MESLKQRNTTGRKNNFARSIESRWIYQPPARPSVAYGNRSGICPSICLFTRKQNLDNRSEWHRSGGNDRLLHGYTRYFCKEADS